MHVATKQLGIDLARVLLRLCGAGPSRYKPRHGETTASGLGEAGSVLQGTAVHRRGDPMGGPVVPHVPDELPRSRADARRPWRHGGPHHPLPLGPGLRTGDREADSAPPAIEQWVVARG